MIKVTKSLIIPDSEIEEKFILASGPGGQNVNKVATAVQLRFNIDKATSLSNGIKQRLRIIAANKITGENILVIESREHTSQERNRHSARMKLASLIRQALYPPKKRKRTHPTLASKKKRKEQKRIRSWKKQLRRKPPSQDDY